jgi:hypothetical protein
LLSLLIQILNFWDDHYYFYAMKFTGYALSAALSSSVLAYPGMAGNPDMANFHSHLASKRQGGAPPPNPELPPALANSNATQIKSCLSGAISCQNTAPKVKYLTQYQKR